MRKSTREVKKPELFQFVPRTLKLRELVEENDHASPETDEEEDLFNDKQVVALKPRAIKDRARSKAMATSSSAAPTTLFGEYLLIHLLTTKIGSHSRSLCQSI